MADYKTPQWLLPNEKNLAYPAAGAETGSGLSEDRHSLYSMDFDGTQYIDCGTSSELKPKLVSCSVWIKGSSSSNPQYTRIVSQDGPTGGADAYGFYVTSTNKVVFAIKTSVTGTVTSSLSSVVLDNNWHNIVGTYDGSNVNIYVDGSVVGSPVSGTGDLTYGSGGFTIGCMSEPTALPSLEFTGQIDEVAIWNKALSATEVAALSTASAPANVMALSAKPIAYYPLGEQAQMGSANWSFPNGSLQSHVVDFNSASSESIILSTSASFKVQAQTVSMWVKPELNTRDPLFLNGHTSVGNVGFEVYQDFGNIRVRINGSSQIIGAVNIGEWNHIFAAYDGADLKYSVNGATIATYNFAATISYSFYTGLILGNSAYGYYDGQTSNVAFWTSDQSSNYVNAYNNGSPQSTYTATPTAWWKLNAANSSYVYPWLISMTGNTDYASGNGCFTSGGVLKWIDTNSQLLSEDEYFTFTTQEVNYSGSITLSTTGGNYESSSSQLEYSLEYKVDQGSWTVWKTQVVNSGTSNTAWTATDVVVNPTSSVQVRLRATGGLFGSSQFTLNDVTIGGLYTETFAVDGIGYTNNTITQPPVDWTFIDTETPAPNYTSALDFTGSIGNEHLEAVSSANLIMQGSHSFSLWLNTGATSDATSYIFDKGGLDYALGFSGNLLRLINYNYQGGGGSNHISELDLDWLTNYANSWHHIVVTVDQPNLLVKLYVDSNLTGTPVALPADYIAPDNTTGGLNIMSYNGTTLSLSGQLSNLAFFNGTVLQQSDIDTIYNNGTPELALSASPTSWWKINNTGTGLVDNAGSDNLTNTGATQIATNVLISNNGTSDTLPTSALIPSDLQFESPYSNYSLDFDGIGNYLNTQSTPLQLGLPATTITASDFSLSFWYYFDANENYDPIIQATSGWTTGFAVFQSTTNTSSLNFWVGNYSSGALYTTQLTSGTWYHIGCVFKGGATHTQEIYVNGVLNNTVSYTTSRVIQNGQSCLIAGNTVHNRYFNGKLDEVAVWSSALSQDQIIQVYNNGYPANIASLSPTAWWRLGEDAYFVGNDITIPNQITGGSTGTGSGTQTAILVGNAPGSYANGSGTNLIVTDRIGDAPESTANSVSINMIPSNRHSYPAGYVPTQVDNAFSMAFDGADDYIYIPSPSLGITNAWSVSTWVKTADKTSDGGSFRGWFATGGWDLVFNFKLAVRSDNGYASVWEGNAEVIVGTSDITDNKWYNIVLTKTASDITLFVNGVQQATVSNSETWTFNNIYIGAGGQSTNITTAGMWNGNIDELAVFDYALSARQIKQDIYEGTTTGKTADLNNISNLTAPVAWYRMGD